MKSKAKFFSWFFGILGAIGSLIKLAAGSTVYQQVYNSSMQRWETQRHIVPYPGWAWIIYGVAILIMIAILIYRDYAVNRGKKLLCGWLTLLFASLVGGILTLCIPYDELENTAYDYESPKSVVTTSSVPNRLYTPKERDEKISIAKTLFERGVITQEEYDKRVKEILLFSENADNLKDN